MDKPEWTSVDAWLEEVRDHRSPEETAVAEKIVAWAHERGLRDSGQTSADRDGVAYMPVITGVDWDPVPFSVLSTGGGRVAVQGSNIAGQGRRPYGQASVFDELLERLRAIPGVAHHKDTYPDITLAELTDPTTFDAFFGLMDEVVTRVRRSNRHADQL